MSFKVGDLTQVAFYEPWGHLVWEVIGVTKQEPSDLIMCKLIYGVTPGYGRQLNVGDVQPFNCPSLCHANEMLVLAIEASR